MHLNRVVPVGVTLWLVATAGSSKLRSEQPSPDDARPGRADYVEMGCYQCHGYEGQGDRSTGPRIAPDPLPFEVFSSWVRRPPDVMPAYSPKILSEERLQRIHDYLISIPPPPDVSTLESFFEN